MMAMVAARAQAEQENDNTSGDDNTLEDSNDQIILEIEDSLILLENPQYRESDV